MVTQLILKVVAAKLGTLSMLQHANFSQQIVCTLEKQSPVSANGSMDTVVNFMRSKKRVREEIGRPMMNLMMIMFKGRILFQFMTVGRDLILMKVSILIFCVLQLLIILGSRSIFLLIN